MTPSKKEFPKKLKVMLVATEASPYASVGGAGSVVGHLSRSLVNLGHSVAVFIPKFGFIVSSCMFMFQIMPIWTNIINYIHR